MKEYLVITEENVKSGVVNQQVIPLIKGINNFFSILNDYLKKDYCTNDHERNNIIIDIMEDNKHESLFSSPIKSCIWITNDIEQKWIHKYEYDSDQKLRRVK